MPKPSFVIKFFGSFFSTFANLESFAGPMSQENSEVYFLLITGMTPFIPLTAYLTAYLPTASAYSKSTFEEICLALL